MKLADQKDNLRVNGGGTSCRAFYVTAAIIVQKPQIVVPEVRFEQRRPDVVNKLNLIERRSHPNPCKPAKGTAISDVRQCDAQDLLVNGLLWRH